MHSPESPCISDRNLRGRQRKSPHSRRSSPTPSSDEEKDTPPPKRKREEANPILTRTGGAYIPPARLRMMQAAISDKNSVAYQRISWEALKKSINGLINKVSGVLTLYVNKLLHFLMHSGTTSIHYSMYMYNWLKKWVNL